MASSLYFIIMGVPKFYRWLSERYACLSQVVKDYQVSSKLMFFISFLGVLSIDFCMYDLVYNLFVDGVLLFFVDSKLCKVFISLIRTF